MISRSRKRRFTLVRAPHMRCGSSSLISGSRPPVATAGVDVARVSRRVESDSFEALAGVEALAGFDASARFEALADLEALAGFRRFGAFGAFTAAVCFVARIFSLGERFS